MTNEEASIIVGNIPINGDECYSISEYQQAKAMAIKALEEPRWISVKDRLPEKNGDYLCTIKTYDYYTEDDNGKFVGHNTHYIVLICNFVDGKFPCTKYYQNYNVIAWQPLPEAYKEEE